MRPPLRFLLVFVLLWTWRPAGAADDALDIDRVLVLELAGHGVDPILARNLSEVFVFAVREARSDAAVLGVDDVRQLLALEAQRQLVGCDEDVSCLVEIGGAMDADHLAVGSVGRVGGRWLLNVRLIGTEEGRVVRQLHEQVEGDPDRLVEAVSQLGGALVDPRRPVGLGRVEIRGAGELAVDGTYRGWAPIEKLFLSPGVHTVSWRTDDRWSAPRRVEVERYGTYRVEPGELGPARGGQPPGGGDVDLGGLVLTAGVASWASATRDDQGTLWGTGPWLRAGWSFGRAVVYGRAFLWDGELNNASGREVGPAFGGAVGAGAGLDFGGTFRVTPLLGLGVVWQQSRLLEVTDGSSVQLEPGLELAYAFGRYLELGASFALNLPFADQVDRGLGVGVSLGIPSQRPGQHPPTGFAQDPAFWITGAVVGMVGTWAVVRALDQAGR